jgi:bifunctional UDP-N-acetylglucosamine pyrophosphorylase/glucosamine-1-phosphate N-acetyltransferase
VENYIKDNFPAVKVVYQDRQLGTAHAVKTAGSFIGEFADNCLILLGDMPLVTTGILIEVAKLKNRSRNVAVLATTVVDNPAGYGRIIKDDSGRIIKIIEESDATPTEKKIKEINPSIYCFDTLLLFKYLDKISSTNSQNEYYLTDIISELAKSNHVIDSVLVEDSSVVEGINDRKQLADLEEIMFKKINTGLMLGGVTIRDPGTSYIDPEAKIGIDTIIEPNCIIKGNTIIGKSCVIGPFTQIVDSVIGPGTEVSMSIVRNSKIGSFNNIGPNSYIRTETTTGKNVRIGSCCEIKKSTIGDNSNVPHLSYVGDTKFGIKQDRQKNIEEGAKSLR